MPCDILGKVTVRDVSESKSTTAVKEVSPGVKLHQPAMNSTEKGNTGRAISCINTKILCTVWDEHADVRWTVAAFVFDIYVSFLGHQYRNKNLARMSLSSTIERKRDCRQPCQSLRQRSSCIRCGFKSRTWPVELQWFAMVTQSRGTLQGPNPWSFLLPCERNHLQRPTTPTFSSTSSQHDFPITHHNSDRPTLISPKRALQDFAQCSLLSSCNSTRMPSAFTQAIHA